MPEPEGTIPSQTLSEFDSITSSLELDLTALFVNMRDDMIDLTDQAVKEGWTVDKYINEVVKLL